MNNLIGSSFRDGSRYCNRFSVDDENSQLACAEPTQPDIGTSCPDHNYWETTQEIYGSLNVTEGDAPMNGFLAIARKSAFKKNKEQAVEVLNGFSPESIPIHRTLAEQFMVADRWFSSFPGPTHVNRAFAHSATSHGYFNNALSLFAGLPQRTIFNDIESSGLSWKSYFQEAPNLATLRQIRFSMMSRTSYFDKFYQDAHDGNLAHYTFLEPTYGKLPGFAGKANDGHAEAGRESFARAEQLLKDVYEAVRNGPQWNSTLLLITYDEHGGYADHVPPPTGVPSPDGIIGYDTHHEGVTSEFTRLGVRVPVLLISPWIAKGSRI